MATIDELENRFKYHPALDSETVSKHSSIRNECHALAMFINDVIPGDSREKSLAITKLEEAMMWANAAIARHS